MKKQFKFPFLTVAFIFITLIVCGQDSKVADSLNLTNGKWTVCTEVKFSADYKCTNGWTNYNFEENGAFTETQEERKWHGTYKFSGNTLTITRNDVTSKGLVAKYGENIYTIIWLDKNRFYHKSNDGPEGIVYTYFERIK